MQRELANQWFGAEGLRRGEAVAVARRPRARVWWVVSANRIEDLMIRLASGDANVREDAVRQLLDGGAASVVAFCGLFCDAPASGRPNGPSGFPKTFF
jgi:hypothetical protein